MSRVGKVVLGLIVVLAAIQLVPIDRTNPPEDGPLKAPPAVMSILERSCDDCHSNRTRWPWYGYVAPFSWLLNRDIVEGREHLNYSTWQRYDAKKQAKLLKETWEEVREGEMPMDIYLIMHRDAALSDADKTVLRDWTEAARANLGVTLPTGPEEEEHEH